MKIAILSGARSNVGDFLIVERTEALIKHVFPNAEIKRYYRNISLAAKLVELNKANFGVFAGGPMFTSHFYPNRTPLVPNLGDIKIPLMTVGIGWRYNADPNYRFSYSFADPMVSLIDKINDVGLPLSCRDNNTVDVALWAGYKNALMTGCPAWYDLPLARTAAFVGGGGGPGRQHLLSRY